MPRLAFLLLTVLLGPAPLPALADVAAATLYADCTAWHIPANVRKAQEWVKVKRCENIVVGAVRGLPWPRQAHRKRNGQAALALTICLFVPPTRLHTTKRNWLIST